MKMVTFYHDIEQDVNVEADGEACREAVRSLLALEASHDVRTTYNVVGALWRDQPDIVEWIRDGRHEVAFHSYNHRIECLPDEFRDEVRLCREHSLDPVPTAAHVREHRRRLQQALLPQLPAGRTTALQDRWGVHA